MQDQTAIELSAALGYFVATFGQDRYSQRDGFVGVLAEFGANTPALVMALNAHTDALQANTSALRAHTEALYEFNARSH